MVVNPSQAEAFLAAGRLAVVGASDAPHNFGGYVCRSLVEHGIDVVAVNPNAETVGGQRCYPSLAAVPGDIDGVVVMVSGPAVDCVICDVHSNGIPRVWLFKGLGGVGAATDSAIQRCNDLGLDVIAGACPLMFLEPVRGAHRVHRLVRRLNHTVGAT